MGGVPGSKKAGRRLARFPGLPRRGWGKRGVTSRSPSEGCHSYFQIRELDSKARDPRRNTERRFQENLHPIFRPVRPPGGAPARPSSPGSAESVGLAGPAANIPRLERPPARIVARENQLSSCSAGHPGGGGGGGGPSPARGNGPSTNSPADGDSPGDSPAGPAEGRPVLPRYPQDGVQANDRGQPPKSGSRPKTRFFPPASALTRGAFGSISPPAYRQDLPGRGGPGSVGAGRPPHTRGAQGRLMPAFALTDAAGLAGSRAKKNGYGVSA